MSKQELFVSGCLLLLFVSAWTAPVKEQADKKDSGVNLSEVEGEEQDLQQLLNLVNQQAHQDDVMVHQEHVTHIENNNGKSVKIEQKEEKVLDTDSGKVLADLKQQKQTDFTPGKQTIPQTVVQTKVDIPQAGVHQTFVQGDKQNPQDTDDEAAAGVDESDDDNNENDNDDVEPDLTPADMAAYLYETQQFSAFYTAMDRLVNESKMVPAEAEAYARAVAVEYERLQLQDLEDRYMLERRAYPQQPLPDNQLYGSLSGYDLYPQPVDGAEQSEPSYDMLNYINSLMTPEEQYLNQRQVQNEVDLMTSDTVDPYQFVAALWNEAYEKGNEEAQEIVRLLYDRVSHDSNPDDIGEIRDILLDTVAQSLAEDTPYAFDTPIDTPLAMPQMPIIQEGAEPSSLNNDVNFEGEGNETVEGETKKENSEEDEREEEAKQNVEEEKEGSSSEVAEGEKTGGEEKEENSKEGGKDEDKH